MTIVAANKRETITQEETIHRILQGEEINAVFDSVFDRSIKDGLETTKAKKAATQEAFEKALTLFKEDGDVFNVNSSEEREKAFAPMYDRRKIARNLGPKAGFNINEVSQLSWGVLQALASDDIDQNMRMKILRLSLHYKEHPGCEHAIKPSSGWMRYYCHKPTQDRFEEIEKLYSYLLEEQGEPLTEPQIMTVQTDRWQKVTANYEEQAAPKLVVEEPVIEEIEEPAIVEEPPVVEEPAIPDMIIASVDDPKKDVVWQASTEVPIVPVVQKPPASWKAPAPVNTDNSMASAMASFSSIIATKNKLIEQYEQQLTVTASMLAEYEKREHDAVADFEALSKERDDLKTRLAKVEEEFQAYKATHANGDAALNNALVSIRRVLANLQDAERHAKTAIGSLNNNG